MYLLSKKEIYLKIPGRDTLSANKVNFKVPPKISHVYEHSPCYIGTKLWDVLPESTQKCDNVFAFKAALNNIHKVYENLL